MDESALYESLKLFLLNIFKSASTYAVDGADVEKFNQYFEPLKIGASYTNKNSYKIQVRDVHRRRVTMSNPKLTPGEFYKNTILGVVKGLPLYDGSFKELDVETLSGEIDFNPKKVSLVDRCSSSHNSTIFGAHGANPAELKFVSRSEFSEFMDKSKHESFGEDCYCKVDSLVEFVRQCHAETGKKVLIVELGPGLGYWINRAGSILNLLGIPFHILSLEYFYFNSINTLRMAKYFGNKGKITSVAIDIHDFDWSRFLQDFSPAFESSIVVHSSSCLQYLNSQIIANMLLELSKLDLYGGCHLEGDAFPLYSDCQKNCSWRHAYRNLKL